MTNKLTSIILFAMLAYPGNSISAPDEGNIDVEFLSHSISLGYEAVPPWWKIEGWLGSTPHPDGSIQYSSQFSLRYQYKVIEYFSIDAALNIFHIHLQRLGDSYNYGTLLDFLVMATGILPLMDDALELSISVGPSFGLFIRKMSFTNQERDEDDTPDVSFVIPFYFLGPNIGLIKIQYNFLNNLFIYIDGGVNYRYLEQGQLMVFSSVGAGAGVRF